MRLRLPLFLLFFLGSFSFLLPVLMGRGQHSSTCHIIYHDGVCGTSGMRGIMRQLWHCAHLDSVEHRASVGPRTGGRLALASASFAFFGGESEMEEWRLLEGIRRLWTRFVPFAAHVRVGDFASARGYWVTSGKLSSSSFKVFCFSCTLTRAPGFAPPGLRWHRSSNKASFRRFPVDHFSPSDFPEDDDT